MKDENEIKLTKEERGAVDDYLSGMKDEWFPEDKISEIQCIVASAALEALSFKKLERTLPESNEERLKALQTSSGAMNELRVIDEGLKTMRKAYLIHPLPPRLCFIADLVFMGELITEKNHEVSSNMYREFVEELDKFDPSELEERAMQYYDLKELVEGAKRAR